MKPLLVLLALFLLVISGSVNQPKHISYTIDRNNEIMPAMFADCSQSFQCQEITGYDNHVMGNSPSVLQQNELHNSIQADLSGKLFAVGAIVF